MPPVAIAGGIAAAGAVGGSLISANANRIAAERQAAAAHEANRLQYKMFKRQRKDAAPWREAGVRALSGLENEDFQRDFTMSDFQKDPGYDFRMQEGMKAIERSAAARGGLNSGATLKSISRYGQDFASNEYSNAYNRFNSDRDRRWNRLSSLAGIGQTANSQVAQAGQNYANQANSNLIGIGNAQAAAGVSTGNSWANTTRQIGNIGAGMAGGLMGQWSQAQGAGNMAGQPYGNGNMYA